MAKNNIAEKLLLNVRDPRIMLLRFADGHSFGSYNRCSVPADFVGQVSGRPLLLEAKETDQESIPYSKLRRNASSHQLDFLERWRLCNDKALGGYFCRIGQNLLFLPLEFINAGPGSISLDHKGARSQLISEPIRLHWLLTGLE